MVAIISAFAVALLSILGAAGVSYIIGFLVKAHNSSEEIKHLKNEVSYLTNRVIKLDILAADATAKRRAREKK
jgi:hypothetical protein